MSRVVKKTGRRPQQGSREEFEMGAVRLVLDEGKPGGAVARELDLAESALGAWAPRAPANRTMGRSGGVTTRQGEELARSPEENRELRLERETWRRVTPSAAGSGRSEVPVGADPGAGTRYCRIENPPLHRAGLFPE
jgi:transposase-like protein